MGIVESLRDALLDLLQTLSKCESLVFQKSISGEKATNKVHTGLTHQGLAASDFISGRDAGICENLQVWSGSMEVGGGRDWGRGGKGEKSRH